MPDPDRLHEVRCPVYKFVELYDSEREIINQPVFQQLRRIRQLGWTDQVYPARCIHVSNIHSA